MFSDIKIYKSKLKFIYSSNLIFLKIEINMSLKSTKLSKLLILTLFPKFIT